MSDRDTATAPETDADAKAAGVPAPEPVLSTPTVAVLAVAVLVGGAIGGLFIVDLGSATPEPVAFDETVSVGLTFEDHMRLEHAETDVDLPRMQVFYSQYPYVVGYYGVESFLARQRDPTHETRFGFPTTAYVTDYADRGLEVTERGLPRTDRSPGWVEAEEAVYVVDSGVRLPSGAAAAMPFSSRAAAVAFVDDHGGSIRTWEELLETPAEVDGAEAVSERTAERHREADETVAATAGLYDRTHRIVVGEDEPTLRDAVDAADADTVVVVPAGIHDGPIEIDRPMTIRGREDARIVGDGNGTVLTIDAPQTAVVGVNVSGVGDATPGSEVTNHRTHGYSADDQEYDAPDADEEWDADIDDDYAGGDAGIAVNADDVLVADTEIHTAAGGIILRDSSGFVVRNATIVGNENYLNGHMGIAAMRSVGVVEHSTIIDGLDGIYTHRADGIVLRDNELSDNRMGIHLMFTSDALLANNTISEQETTGIYVMTGPQGNAIVGNRIVDNPTALSVGGSDTYVADNVLRDNWLALRIEVTASIFEGNVIADNHDGVETWALLPTNRVTRNDFVGNEDHVSSSSGRLRVWTHDGVGNYWEGATGTTDGTVIQRPYTATDPVDGRLHRVDGTETLARAPAVDALAGFEGAIPGMRSGEVIDTAPLCSPANEAFFERTNRTDVEPICRSERRQTTETSR